jgi:hypothetical protein
MRVMKLACVLVAGLALTGCLTSQTVVNVKKDGSGTIESTTTMTAEAAKMFSSLAAGVGKELGAKGEATDPLDIFSEAQMKEAASKLGQGVTFVSSERIKTADREGRRAIYAFTDVTKLTVDQRPSTPGSAPAAGGPIGSDGKESMVFQFAKNVSGSVLTVRFPEAEFGKGAAAPRDGAKSPIEEQQALMMMKQMFKGLKIGIDVQVDGQIVKTNSPYVTGSRVTLLEMDFGQILDDPGRMEQLQRIKSIEEAKRVLKDVKGFKVNLDREVMIEFR